VAQGPAEVVRSGRHQSTRKYTVMDMEHFLAQERKYLADLVACRV
jgi:hypothetical protein